MVHENADPDAARGKRPRFQTAQDEDMTQAREDHEGEASLLQDKTDDEWRKLEQALERTEMLITFSMNESSVEIEGCYVSLSNLASEIIEECNTKGVQFEDDQLTLYGTDRPFLAARPTKKGSMQYRNL